MVRLPGTVLLASFVALVILAGGCGSSTSSEPELGACTDCAPSSAPCPEGFTRDAATGACMDDTPAEDCAPGTGAFLGSTTCQPVGWTTCAAPFERDPSGWGCRPVVAGACPAGTLAPLGSRACKPVGDCDAPFPPAGATHFVDASATTTDATHFTSIFEAAQAANAGAIIAVAPGTYVEDVDVVRSDVSIIGKCAAQVIVKNPGDKRAGVLVTAGAKNVLVRGLTLTGHYSGILVRSGGQARIEDSLIVKNRYLGAYVAEVGSRLQVARTLVDDVVAGDADKFGWGAAAQLGGALELEDVVIHAPTGGGVVIGGAQSTGKLTRVVVRAPRLGIGGSASALAVVDGGSAELDGGLFEDPLAVGVSVSGGSAVIEHLLVRRTAATKAPETGRGIQVSSRGRLDLSESLVTGSEDAQLLAVGEGVSAKVARSVFLGSAATNPGYGLRGVRVGGGASLELASSALVDNVDAGLSLQDPGSRVTANGILVTGTRPRAGWPDPGLLGVGVSVTWGSSLALSHSSIDRNRAANVLVSEPDASGAAPHADLASTLVRRALPNEVGFAGRGVEVSKSGTATVEGCVVAENNEESVVTGRGGRLAVARTLIRDTRRAAGTFGHGLVAADQGSVSLDEVWLLGHPAVALAISDADATVSRSVIARSAVGIAVAGGTALQSAERVPSAPPALTCVVSNDTRFVENETRVGSGAVPLPDPLGGTQGPVRAP